MLEWQCGIMTLFMVFREITDPYQISLILNAEMHSGEAGFVCWS